MDDSRIIFAFVTGALMVTILAMPGARDGFTRGARRLLHDHTLQQFTRIGFAAAFGAAILTIFALLS
jgi:hypothetical protein